MFEAHDFAASRPPTPREVHCLMAHLTNKRNLPLKVEHSGRKLSALLAEGECEADSVALDTNAFTFRRTRLVEPWSAEVGDIATLSTRLCFTIHRRDERGNLVKRSPFDLAGSLKRKYRHHFLAYLEERTGLTGLLAGEHELGIVPMALPSEKERRQKVWMNGVVELKLRARIGDAERFGRLAGEAIGNRRSYGFGAVSCDDLEPDPVRERSVPQGRSAHAARRRVSGIG